MFIYESTIQALYYFGAGQNSLLNEGWLECQVSGIIVFYSGLRHSWPLLTEGATIRNGANFQKHRCSGSWGLCAVFRSSPGGGGPFEGVTSSFSSEDALLGLRTNVRGDCAHSARLSPYAV